MRGNIVEMFFFGLVSGFAEILPISAPAHQYLLSYICGFDGRDPVLLMCVHMAILAALAINCRHKIAHLFHENKIASIKRGRRKRQPDLVAVADSKLLVTALIPITIGLLVKQIVCSRLDTLLILAVFLVFNGVILYIPQFIDVGNRDARHLSRADGLLMGIISAIDVLPGVSRIAASVLFGQARKGNRAYILDMVLLLSIVWLAGLTVLDVTAIFGSVSAPMEMVHVIGYLLATAAAFGGAYGAVVLVRYLAVRIGFSGLTYYSWGIGFVCFILYLMI